VGQLYLTSTSFWPESTSKYKFLFRGFRENILGSLSEGFAAAAHREPLTCRQDVPKREVVLKGSVLRALQSAVRPKQCLSCMAVSWHALCSSNPPSVDEERLKCSQLQCCQPCWRRGPPPIPSCATCGPLGSSDLRFTELEAVEKVQTTSTGSLQEGVRDVQKCMNSCTIVRTSAEVCKCRRTVF
jgi:hypothetical protein